MATRLWGQQTRDYLPPQPARLNKAGRLRLATALREVAPAAQVLTEPADLMAYAYDATGERYWPDVVVLPSSEEEVGRMLAVARRFGLPVIARGAGTNLSGGTIPLMGGMVLGMARLSRIRDINRNVLRMRAEPGVVNADAQATLSQFNLFYPPDPSSHRISTLGGNVAENSGGPHCVKYGVTVNHVLGLAGFLRDGTPLCLAREGLPGYLDLAGVVTGSEGTLMVVTEAELRIRPRPLGTATLLAVYPQVGQALTTVGRMVLEGLEPSCLELLDQATIALVEPFVQAGYPVDAGAVLLIEVEGSDEERRTAADEVVRLAHEDGAMWVRTATTADEADRLWRGRRAAYGALARQSAHVWVQDVTVPRPELPAMMEEVIDIGRRHGLDIITVAHAGDGNFHPNIAFDPADPDQLARMRAADREILEACVRRNGSITGEHGIGLDKLASLALMYGDGERDLMMGIKAAFDPELALNPYKAVLPPQSPGLPDSPSPALPQSWAPRTADAVQEAVRAARSAGLGLRVRGSGLRVSGGSDAILLSLAELNDIQSIDAGNLTATVDAGVRLGQLAEVLAPYGLEWPVDGWAPDETVGGVAAGALPAWREAGEGPVRDHVLGVEVVDGQGRLMRFGRPTIKNVAGYDVTKLLIGSWGSLGVITRLILRLRKRVPLHWSRLARADCTEAIQAARRLMAGPTRPKALVIRDTNVFVAWTSDDEGGQEIADPRGAWGNEVRESGIAFGYRHPAQWDNTPVEARLGAPGTFVWPDSGHMAGPCAWVRDHSDVWRRVGDVKLPEDPVLGPLTERVRRAWDPDAVFSRGGG